MSYSSPVKASKAQTLHNHTPTSIKRSLDGSGSFSEGSGGSHRLQGDALEEVIERLAYLEGYTRSQATQCRSELKLKYN